MKVIGHRPHASPSDPIKGFIKLILCIVTLLGFVMLIFNTIGCTPDSVGPMVFSWCSLGILAGYKKLKMPTM